MEIHEKIILCRFCLKICDSSKVIERDTKEALNILLPKLDLAAIQDPTMCTSCAEMVIKCFDFKSTCLCTRDYLLTFVNKDDVKVDLKDVCLSRNVTNTAVAEDEDICGFCMDLVKSCSAVSLRIEMKDIMLGNMIGQCLPELDLSIIKNPVICVPCHKSLEYCFHFVTNCLIVEEKIKQYCASFNINSEEIDLSRLLQLTTSKVNDNSVDIIKAEEQFCEERENADEGQIVKLEQMFCEDNETVKEEVEHKDKIDIGDVKFNNEEQFIPTNMLSYKEESKSLDVTKTEEMFCVEEFKEQNLVEMEDEKMFPVEEILIKADKHDFNRFEDDIAQPAATTKSDRRPNVKGDPSESYIKRILTNKPSSEIPTYTCDSCPYQTKTKRCLKSHSLRHEDPLKVTTYACNSCPYRTKYRGGLKTHLLVHKSFSEVTMYACNSCSYQTNYKQHLKSHFLKHKDPSEITMYTCNSCPFKSKYNSALKTHSLVHKRSPEATTYTCDSCSYQTNYKRCLKNHLQKHKDPEVSDVLKKRLPALKNHSQATTYACNSCSYQTKFKRYLVSHVLKHSDPLKVTTYTCNSCPFESKYSSALKNHRLVHKSPLDIPMYTCNVCPYQTRYKAGLKGHLLVHKSSSEGTAYACDSCQFRTNYKNSLKKHSLKHKSSGVTVFTCNSCPFQTRFKAGIKTHLQAHRNSSKAATYRCDHESGA